MVLGFDRLKSQQNKIKWNKTKIMYSSSLLCKYQNLEIGINGLEWQLTKYTIALGSLWGSKRFT